ncbi:MAG: YhbY family RNA-binding protein [Betaproteobacteria bacterium]|nr:YhbY family RNA-binding protein [Betaproteobacteria bacterium]MDH5222559.1 YhbY family RNA-binding protein [Betaproteobacteria bacterium]MDH5352283.1 YhbY family RNA-binding protein [Betaproteobacteria bacterium]
MLRKLLKARAHALRPILQLGEKGLTDAVVAEIDRALGAHELIKVRAATLNREEREVALASICERTGGQPVQHVGKMLVLYRPKPRPETEPGPKPRLPKRARATSGWDERKDARKMPARRRKSAGPQRPQRRRPRA